MGRLAIHPGEHLAEQLEELNMSAEEFAAQVGTSVGTIQAILDGEAGITGDAALRFGHFFGTSAEFWMNLQKLYELRLAEQESGQLIKALPRLSELRGWNSGNSLTRPA